MIRTNFLIDSQGQKLIMVFEESRNWPSTTKNREISQIPQNLCFEMTKFGEVFIIISSITFTQVSKLKVPTQSDQLLQKYTICYKIETSVIKQTRCYKSRPDVIKSDQ